MAHRLSAAGFWVTQIPFNNLSEPHFKSRIEDIQSLWLDD